MRRAALPLLAVLALAGCSSSPVVTGASPSTTFPGGVGLTVVLDPDGLGFASGATPAASAGAKATAAAVAQLAFSNSSQVAVMSELVQALGPGTTPAPTGCQLDQVVEGGFTVFFANGEFVGWMLTGSDPPLTTVDGIAIGTSVADLQKLRPDVTIAPAGLGAAFNTASGGLSGLLSGSDESSTIGTLFAGRTCSAPVTTSPTPTPVASTQPSPQTTASASPSASS